MIKFSSLVFQPKIYFNHQCLFKNKPSNKLTVFKIQSPLFINPTHFDLVSYTVVYQSILTTIFLTVKPYYSFLLFFIIFSYNLVLISPIEPTEFPPKKGKEGLPLGDKEVT